MDTLKVWLGKKKLLVGCKKEQFIEKMVQAMGILFDQGACLSSCFQLPLSYPQLDIAVKLKSWIYKCCRITPTSGHDDVTTLVKNKRNAADHWARFVLKLILLESVYNIQMQKRRDLSSIIRPTLM